MFALMGIDVEEPAKRHRAYTCAMDFGARSNFLGICGGIAVALAVGFISGVWVVGIVLGVAVAVSTAEKMRRRASLAQQQAPIEVGRRKRKG